MSTKPASVARWAETSPGVTSGSIVVPTSGKKDIGFVGSERPPAEYLNFLHSLAYEWQQYLSDGAFQGAISSDTSVSAPVLKFTTALEKSIPQWLSTDNPGGVNGRGTIHNAGAFLAGWTFAASSSPVYYPLLLNVGDVLTGYQMTLHKGDTTNPVNIDIVTTTLSGPFARVEGPHASGVGAGTTTLGLASGVNLTILTQTMYYLRITPGGTATPTNDQIENVRIFYTHP